MDTPPKRTGYHHGSLRDALLAAAEEELTDKGVEAFTLRGVAKRAGVSHAAPAHHFKDTKAMLTALASVAAQRLLASMQDSQRQAAPSPRAQMVASGAGYVKFALANPALFNLMFGSQRPDSHDDAFRQNADASFNLLVEGVAAIAGADPMQSDLGRQRVAAAWSQVHGIATLLIAGRMEFMRPQLDRDFDATLTALIGDIVPRQD